MRSRHESLPCPLLPSYANGTSAVPAARRDDRRQPRPHGGGRSATARRSSTCHRAALDLRGARAASTWWPGACSRTASTRATGSASGRRTAPSGRWCSTPRPRSARSWSTSTRPTARTSCEYALRQSGCRLLIVRAVRSSPATTGPWSPRCGPELPGRSSGSCSSGRRELGRAPGGGRGGVPADRLRRRAGRARLRTIRSTSSTRAGTTGFPKGATLSHHNILNNGFFVGELCGYTEADRVCLPVPFYHCFGMVMGNLGATTHGATHRDPGAGLRPGGHALEAVGPERCTSLYGVPTMFIAELGHPDFARYDLSSLRTGIMAGSPCPVEVMKRVIAEMHMERGHHLLRHDRDLAGVDPDRAGRPLDGAWRRSAGSIPTSRSRSSTRHRPHVAARRSRASSAPAATRSCSATGTSPSKTAEAIDAAGWMHTGDLATMDDDGLRQHRRAHQGPGHPGRRERLPARDRGVPLRPPRHRGRRRSSASPTSATARRSWRGSSCGDGAPS